MLTVTVWCLPENRPQEWYHMLHGQIVQAATEVPDFGVNSEKDLLTLMPKDLMAYGLGTEIKIEITDYFRMKGLEKYGAVLIADKFGRLIKRACPKAHVVCTAEPFDRSQRGIWDSASEEAAEWLAKRQPE